MTKKMLSNFECIASFINSYSNNSYCIDLLGIIQEYIIYLENQKSHRNMQIKELRKKYTMGLFSYDNVKNDWEKLVRENQELKKKVANLRIIEDILAECPKEQILVSRQTLKQIINR